MRWTDLTPPEWLDREEREVVPELKIAGSLRPYEKEYFRKDGTRVPVLIGLARFEEGGEPEGVAFVLDLREQREAGVRSKARERVSGVTAKYRWKWRTQIVSRL